MKTRVLASLLAASVSACASPLPAPDYRADASELLSGVNAADGISREEAERIGQAYFLTNVGCGTYRGISNAPEHWIVEGAFGYAAQPIKDFTINKKTGAVSSPVGPSYERPIDMVR